MKHSPPDDVRIAPPLGRKWSIPGGTEDEASITLYVVTIGDPEGLDVRRWNLMIPLACPDGELVVGTPQIHELTEEKVDGAE